MFNYLEIDANKTDEDQVYVNVIRERGWQVKMA